MLSPEKMNADDDAGEQHGVVCYLSRAKSSQFAAHFSFQTSFFP